MTSIVWFRQDLRLHDQPALTHAFEKGEPIVPLYIFSPGDEGIWAPGGASKWWLHRSLQSLAGDLEKLGSRLVVRSGDASSELMAIVKESGAKQLFWNRRYEPEIRDRDARIKEVFKSENIEAESFSGSLLLEPWNGAKSDKSAYQVFTPFSKNLLAKVQPRAFPQLPSTLPAPKIWPKSLAIDDLKLEPTLDWASGFRDWIPGESGAAKNLARFLASAKSYQENRNLPAVEGTSRLSPHLHFGEISPNQIFKALVEKFGTSHRPEGVETYLKEIVWREFAYHLLYFFPHTVGEPLREKFRKFPWKNDTKLLKAWQKGMTGYPIVDAGMRELWTTGWMHNRVRMIVASFLVKDLLIPWQEGARWFWDTLLDADLASNTLGWQWTSGCGADAAPYFRIFNPVLQGEKFDPQGEYVRRWVPEVAGLSNKWIHKPWEAPEKTSYPKPIVDHSEARDAALDAYEALA